MHPDRLQRMLADVAAGDLPVSEAMEALRHFPAQDLGFAQVDHQRALRNGAPEVIFGSGKEPEHIASIVKSLLEQDVNVLCTRASEAAFKRVAEVATDAEFHQRARCITVKRTQAPSIGTVGIVCAGTSDLPVAEEAAVSATFFGAEVVRLFDVGVAGVHRLLRAEQTLRSLDVAIVVAGMEGALPSVVGGLVPTPIIAVPTSVGYGASFGGIAALLGMLNSCASGVTVVNIDNGFGAAAAAHRILYRPA